MKHNYDRVKTVQISLSKLACEESSLDNLIRASFNPLGGARQRVDSLQHIRDEKFGRKRAMTVGGPVMEKYVPLRTSKHSAFSSYKHVVPAAEYHRPTKDSEEESKEADHKVEELKMSRKRTFAMMKRDFHAHSSQQLITPNEDFPGRKRAKSF